MKTCSHCGWESSRDAKTCSRCGFDFNDQKSNNRLPKAIIIFIYVWILFFVMGILAAIFVPLFNTHYGTKDNFENKNENFQECDNVKHIISFRDSKDNLLMDNGVLKAGGAKVGQDENGRPAIHLSIADKGKFYDVTSRISQQEDNLIVIWLDYDGSTSFEKERESCGGRGSKCLSAATVSQGFASDVIIQGSFGEPYIEEIVNKINCSFLVD